MDELTTASRSKFIISSLQLSGIYTFLSESLELTPRMLIQFNRGAFDISLIASIASHLTYWADEDVNHFMLSQMLSRNGRHRSDKD